MSRHTKPYLRIEKADGVVTVTAVAAVRNGHRRLGSIRESLSDRPAVLEQVRLLMEQVRSLQSSPEMQADG